MTNSAITLTAKLWRAGLTLSAAAALFALSYGENSRAFPENNDGFLYSEYLQHPTTSALSETAFSVSTPTPFWRAPVNDAQNAVDAMSLTDILANDFINDESAGVYTQQQLHNVGLQLGADIVRQGAFSALNAFGGGGLKHVNVDLETETGRGLTHVGIDAIGAIHETRHNAAAWQLRGYSGFEDSRYGFNLGGIYRQAVNNTLLGGNVFLDYETFDGDAFWRWSLGGEARSPWVDLFANYYNVLSDAVAGNDSTQTYSANGFDVAAHVHSPRLRTVTGILGYYSWEGEYGQDDETGLLLGVRYTPSAIPLLVQLNYRTGDGTSFGGRVAYVQKLDNSAVGSQSRQDVFFPEHYFFAPVEREHTQRIAKVQVTPTEGMQIRGLIADVRAQGFNPPSTVSVATTAGVRGVEPFNTAGVGAMSTNVDLRGVDNLNIEATGGTLRGVTVTTNITMSLPWTLLPSSATAWLFVGEDTATELTVGWRSGAGDQAVIYGHTTVSVSSNDMNVVSGRVSVNANSGFRVITPENVDVSLNSPGRVSVNTDTGEIVAMGEQLMVVAQDGSGPISLFIIGGDRDDGISLTYSSGQVDYDRIGDGRIEEVNQAGTVTVAPLIASVNPSTSPIRVSVGHTGSVAIISASGGDGRNSYMYSGTGDSELAVNASSGVVSATEQLTADIYRLTVSVTRGTEMDSVVVVVEAGSVTMIMDMDMDMTMAMPSGQEALSIVVQRLNGLGTSDSPIELNAGHSGVVARVSVINPTDGVTYMFVAHSMTPLAVNDEGAVSTIPPALLAGSYMIPVMMTTAGLTLEVTVHVSVAAVIIPPELNVNVAVQEEKVFGGSGASDSPIQLVADYDGVIATVSVTNPADGVDYMFVADSMDSLAVDANGVVSAPAALSEGSYMIPVMVTTADLTLGVTVHVSVRAPVVLQPGLNIIVARNLAGEVLGGDGTMDMPIVVPEEHDRAVATVVLNDAEGYTIVPGQAMESRSEGGDYLQVNADGSVRVGDEQFFAGQGYAITVSATHATEQPLVVTVYATVHAPTSDIMMRFPNGQSVANSSANADCSDADLCFMNDAEHAMPVITPGNTFVRFTTTGGTGVYDWSLQIITATEHANNVIATTANTLPISADGEVSVGTGVVIENGNRYQIV